MSLEKSVTHSGQLTILALNGDLEISNAEEFIDLVRGLVEGGHKHLYLDLEHLNTIDSSGLGSLIRILTVVRKQDGSLLLRKPPASAFKVFEITRLDKFFTFVDSKEEVVKFLKVNYDIDVAL